MSSVLPSSEVGVKINEWYKMIRQFSVPDAEILKAEVEQEINEMEEDEYLLIYYTLMKFRHQCCAIILYFSAACMNLIKSSM